MKKPLLTTLTALTAFVPATATRRPNILLFMVDDMGW